MLTFGMVVIFAGYTVGSYGWVLLKGWDIPFRAWVSPLNPYQWPADGSEPPTVGPAQLFPSSKGTEAPGAREPGAPGSSAGDVLQPPGGRPIVQ